MRVLAIDIETYSDIDLRICGVYAYTDSTSFEILLFAYAVDDSEVIIVDLACGEMIPKEILAALTDDSIVKTAFNAAFERICLSRYLGVMLSPISWVCTAVQAAILTLPFSLEGVGEVLNIESKKLKEGSELIRYFSLPCKATKSNGGRTRNLPEHAPDKWEFFKKYCIRDVEAERDIRVRLNKYEVSDKELEIYRLDQEINDRGIQVDTELVNKAIGCDTKNKEKIVNRAYELTGLSNPNSVAQLKGWLLQRGVRVEALNKKSVNDLINVTTGDVLEVLKLRLLMAKTSVKKYEAIERSLCVDGRVHGLFQFYGANRTGRWAGRLVQVQNLPQNHIVDLELARNLVKHGRYEDIELLYDSTPEVLSELIRTAFVPKEGYKFIVADFSAIEARVLAWISGEDWRIRVFESHGKIYEASASAMFGVPIDDIDKGSGLRQKGKIAELALGYGGAVGALISMGALEMGVDEEELLPLVNQWRNANSHITKFWWDIGAAAIKAVKEKREVIVGRITFSYKSGILFIVLPSGRSLAYIKPRLEINKFGREGLTYEGIGESKRWTRIDTYGPKLVENIVQAISRDILAEAMLRLRDSGFNIVMHVHDEVVIEAIRSNNEELEMGNEALRVEKEGLEVNSEGVDMVKEVCDIMAIQPEWAVGLPLRADGYECSFYKKE